MKLRRAGDAPGPPVASALASSYWALETSPVRRSTR